MTFHLNDLGLELLWWRCGGASNCATIFVILYKFTIHQSHLDYSIANQWLVCSIGNATNLIKLAIARPWALAIGARSTMRKAGAALARRLAIIFHAMMRDKTEFQITEGQQKQPTRIPTTSSLRERCPREGVGHCVDSVATATTNSMIAVSTLPTHTQPTPS